MAINILLASLDIMRARNNDINILDTHLDILYRKTSFLYLFRIAIEPTINHYTQPLHYEGGLFINNL